MLAITSVIVNYTFKMYF